MLVVAIVLIVAALSFVCGIGHERAMQRERERRERP